MKTIRKIPRRQQIPKKKNVYSIPKLSTTIGKSSTTIMLKSQLKRVLIAVPSAGKISALYIQMTGPREVPNPN